MHLGILVVVETRKFNACIAMDLDQLSIKVCLTIAIPRCNKSFRDSHLHYLLSLHIYENKHWAMFKGVFM